MKVNLRKKTYKNFLDFFLTHSRNQKLLDQQNKTIFQNILIDNLQLKVFSKFDFL